MSGYFLDTSALVKRYRPEAGADVVDGVFAEAGSLIVISRLAIVETSSALAMHVRTRQLSIDHYALTRKKLLGDVSQGIVKVVRLLVRHYQDAERLIERHATVRRLRTLDSLQLSVALDLLAQRRVDKFVCADRALCEIALLEGMQVVNPSPFAP